MRGCKYSYADEEKKDISGGFCLDMYGDLDSDDTYLEDIMDLNDDIE